MFRLNEKIQLILSAILIIMLNCCFFAINFVSPLDNYFIQPPEIISKTMIQKDSQIILSITTSFVASEFDNEPLNAYLTTKDVISNNFICPNSFSNDKTNSTLI